MGYVSISSRFKIIDSIHLIACCKETSKMYWPSVKFTVSTMSTPRAQRQ